MKTIDMLLKIENIEKSFPAGRPGEQRKILDSVSLELKEGETASILGPSGSGKSTLLNIAGALDKPDAGNVIFNGENITEFEEDQLAQFRNREIGFVFQMHHLLPQCTVLENVLIPALPIKDREIREKSRQRALDLIKMIGLWNQKDQYPGVLSGGEQQRVAVIRALINRPKLLLADEPTGSLDQDNAQSVASLLLELNKEYKLALLVVTHAREIASRMSMTYELISGKLKLK